MKAEFLTHQWGWKIDLENGIEKKSKMYVKHSFLLESCYKDQVDSANNWEKLHWWYVYLGFFGSWSDHSGSFS